MNKYKIKGTKLIISDTEITFDFPIKEAISESGMLILLIESPIGIIYNENVFGVSLFEKMIKWQIEKRKKLYPGWLKDCPFTGIIRNEGKLRLHNWCSLYLIIDPITGKILEEGETR